MDQEDAKPNDQSWPEEAVFMQRQQDVRIQNTIISATASLISYLEGHTTKAEVVNQLSEIGTPDVFKVVDALNALHNTLKTHENTDLTEITKVMQDLLNEAKQIPKELPEEKEQPFVDYTKQFSSLVSAVQAVEKVIKQQKLVAEAPVVNVPEAIVHVDKPDFDPLQNSIRDVVDAVQGIVIPEYQTDNKNVEKLLTKANKLLIQILDKPVKSGGGSGGGRATPYQDISGIPAFVTLKDGNIPIIDAVYTQRYDYSGSPIIYVGYALVSTINSSLGWTINKYDLTTSSSASGKVATNVSWDNRITGSFN